MADTTTSRPTISPVALFLDAEDIELLAVVVQGELDSDPEDHALMPGELADEMAHRAAFHPRLRDILVTLQAAMPTSPPCASFSAARPRPTRPSIFDQDAPAERSAR